jgi:hypothetical protein
MTSNGGAWSEKSGIANTGAVASFSLIVSNATWQLDDHSQVAPLRVN